MKKIAFPIFLISQFIFSQSSSIRINEIYTEGGKSDSTFNSDYIELINTASTSQSLSGLYLQFCDSEVCWSAITLPALQLQPNDTFLVKFGGDSVGGIALPTPDLVNNKNLKLPLKVAIRYNGAPPVTYFDVGVSDFVGIGNGNSAEQFPAVAPTSTKSISRTNGIDTNNNFNDFTLQDPSPKNSVGQYLSIKQDIKNNPPLFVLTNFGNTILFKLITDYKITNSVGQIIYSGKSTTNSQLNISEFSKGIYYVSMFSNGKIVNHKFIKQ